MSSSKRTTKPKSKRYNQAAMLHMPVSYGLITDADYREILFDAFGVTSSKALSEAQIKEVIATFRSMGWLDGRGAGGSQREGQPTPLQWAKLAGLARKLWPEGLKSHGLQAWVKNTWGIDAPRFLTAEQMAKVIYGLECWLSRVEQKHDGAGGSPATDADSIDD